ncbi:hypothetical protein [Paraburkholderia terrae]|nr:hypothetical protein [Paraburkholderia terrae]BDC38937.1 hypothetical protein PTKU15_22340 [Paraburkholderia terrae]
MNTTHQNTKTEAQLQAEFEQRWNSFIQRLNFRYYAHQIKTGKLKIDAK